MGSLPRTSSMGRFSISKLIMCGQYQKLTSQDYLRLGLCVSQDCLDCHGGQGHYVKNDGMLRNNLVLNNQLPGDKLHPHQPIKKIVNNLKITNDSITKEACDQCKAPSTPRPRSNQGFVNLAFIDQKTEVASWYQPHMSREVAVKIISDCPVGSFIVRNSMSHMSQGFLAITVRVPRSFNGTGILNYLIVVSEVGFRIKGFTKVFQSLNGLIVHHTVMKENLPCRLLLEEEEGSEDGDRDTDFADLDSDPEYPDLVVRLAEQLSNK